jgi:hypothetical protein
MALLFGGMVGATPASFSAVYCSFGCIVTNRAMLLPAGAGSISRCFFGSYPSQKKGGFLLNVHHR